MNILWIRSWVSIYRFAGRLTPRPLDHLFTHPQERVFNRRRLEFAAVFEQARKEVGNRDAQTSEVSFGVKHLLCLAVCWLVGFLVGWCVIISEKGSDVTLPSSNRRKVNIS